MDINYPHKDIKTFDIFDTLISRKCIHPQNIFQEVEARSSAKGFTYARIKSEQDICHNEYNFNDIYNQLRNSFNVSEENCRILQSLEIEAELANVIPIVDNLKKVNNNSILITDMYLPEDVIRKLLRVAGLNVDPVIIKTSDGKRKGLVWKNLKDLGYYCDHLGDNYESDVTSALKFGMRAQLYDGSKPTKVELLLLENNLPELAKIIRCCRLSTSNKLLLEWQLNLTFGFNIPLMIILCVLIFDFVKQNGIKHVLFSTRDCVMIKLLFDKLLHKFNDTYNYEVISELWYTSRLTRIKNDFEYLNYCKSMFSNDSLIVDLCGSGVSLFKLLNDMRLFPNQLKILLCSRINKDNLSDEYQKVLVNSPAEDVVKIHSFFDNSSFINNEILEILSYIDFGMVSGVKNVCGNYIPEFLPIEFSDNNLNILKNNLNVLTHACEIISSNDNNLLFLEIINNRDNLNKILLYIAHSLESDFLIMNNTFRQDHRVFDNIFLSNIRNILSN